MLAIDWRLDSILRGREDSLSNSLRPLYLAAAVHVCCAAVLMPLVGHPYDFVALTGPAEAWLRWGFPLLYHWKFGFDFALLGAVAQLLRMLLQEFGMSGMAAIHVAWKLPLVISNLLSGLLVYRLGRRLAPDKAVLLASLWLVNPVLLWVSAGHGQVEGLALLSIFGAVELLLADRVFLAGIVTGLGVGIEYVPISVAAVVFIWWRQGRLNNRMVSLYGMGTASALILCFAPLMLDPVARSGIVGGLASTTGIGVNSVSVLSVWSILGDAAAGQWFLVLAVVGLGWIAYASILARDGLGAGIVALAGLLVLAVLLDKNSVAQFTLIAAGGFWLLALVVDVHPLMILAVPLAGLLSYFLYPFDLNTFLYDVWSATGQAPFRVPISYQLSTFLGSVFVLGSIALFAYALIVSGRKGHRRFAWVAGLGVAVAISIGMASLTVRPNLWSSVTSSGPTQLADFSWMVASRPGEVAQVGPTEFRISFDDSLLAASRESQVHPTGALKIHASVLASREQADVAMKVGQWPHKAITIANWPQIHDSVRDLWVEVLVGESTWLQPSQIPTASLYLQDHGSRIHVARAVWVAPGWARVSFRVPSTFVDAAGTLELDPQPLGLYWNGSASGPWVRVLPATGTIDSRVDGRPSVLAYDLGPDGVGNAAGLPLQSGYLVQLNDAQLPGVEVLGSALQFPETRWMVQLNLPLAALATGYVAVLVAISLLYSKHLVASRLSARDPVVLSG